jgi:PAS domain S-box-containing protein
LPVCIILTDDDRLKGTVIMSSREKTKKPTGKQSDPGQVEGAIHWVSQDPRLVLEASPVAMLITTFDGQIVYANQRCSEQYGMDINSSGRNTTWFYTHPEERLAVLRTLRRNGRLDDREICINKPDGSPMWLLVSARCVDMGGENVILSSLLDITEQKLAENALQVSEEKFRTMIEQASEGFALVDEDGLIIEWNQAMEHIWGFPREGVLGQLFSEIQYRVVIPERRTPEYYEYHTKALKDAIHTGQSPIFNRIIEVELYRPDGQRVFVQQIIFPIKTGRGYRIGSMSLDISARKQVEDALRESEERFSRLAAAAFEGIGITQNDLVVDANPQLAALLGYEMNELLGLNFMDMVAPESRPSVIANAETGNDGPYEHLAVKKDGTIFPVEVRARSITHRGQPARVAIIRDITERKRAEDALRESEERYRKLVAASPDGITILGMDGLITYVSKNMLVLHGEPRMEDVLGRSPLEWIALSDKERAAKALANVYQGIGTPNLEYLMLKKDGSTYWGEINADFLTDAGGRPMGVIAATRDVTGRKQAEENLNRQIERLRALHNIEQAILGSMELNMILKLLVREVVKQLHVDAAAVLLFNPEKQTLDYSFSAGFHTKALRYTSLGVGSGLGGKAAQKRKTVHIANLAELGDNPTLSAAISGEKFISYYGVPLIAKGQLQGVLEIFHRSSLAPEPDWLTFLDTLAGQASIAINNARMLELTQAHLKETEALYRINQGLVATIEPLQLMNDVVDLLKKNFGYHYVQIFVREPETGDFVMRAGSGKIGKELAAEGYRLAAGEGIVSYTAETGAPFFTNNVDDVILFKRTPHLPETKSELAVPIKVGDLFLGLLDVQQAPPDNLTQQDMQLVSAVADQLAVALQKAQLLTDLQTSLRQEKETRAQLIHSEKLAVVGRLLASVSHEMNNPLQAIQNALYLLGEEKQISAQGQQDLKIVLSETERMATLLDRLRATYQPVHEQDFQAIQINALIEDVHALVATHLRHARISYEYHPDPNLPEIPGLSGQLRQVVLNLFMNAVDAMNDGGRLAVSTHYLKDTNEALMTVSDTGMGISPAILPVIFEPFTTNKEKGTGLGLAISYEIVFNHKGRIQAENNPDKGAKFSVWLPIGSGSEK